MVKLVAVDIDGTFMRKNYTYDEARFERIFERMKAAGCNFVVASGNQYWQLRDIFAKYGNEVSFVSDNGAYVEARGELLFAGNISKDAVAYVKEFCKEYGADIFNFMCGAKSAYYERGSMPEDFVKFMKRYMPRMEVVDDFRQVEDRILKFALNVPEEKTYAFYDIIRDRLKCNLVPTTSGHGSIDLIVPGCHKASGIKRLVEHFGISPAECVAFGDGGNDIEMLKYCGESYAMDNAPQAVKDVAKYVCPSNNDDGVLVTLDKIFS